MSVPVSTTYPYTYPPQMNPGVIGAMNVLEIDDWLPGVPSNAAVIVRRVLTRACTFPANFAGSQISGTVAATGASAFLVQRIPAGSTTPATIATLTIGAAATNVTTYSTQAAVACAVGDTIVVLCPATADATLANIACNLLANLYI